MPEDKIVVPPKVKEELRKMIQKDIRFDVSERPFDIESTGCTIGFGSEERALEHLEKEWVKERQLKSEFVFCPHCEKRLDIARNFVNEHKEAIARLLEVIHFIEGDEGLRHALKYTYTKKSFKDGLDLERFRGILEKIANNLEQVVHGESRQRYYFPEKRTPIQGVDKK